MAVRCCSGRCLEDADFGDGFDAEAFYGSAWSAGFATLYGDRRALVERGVPYNAGGLRWYDAMIDIESYQWKKGHFDASAAGENEG